MGASTDKRKIANKYKDDFDIMMGDDAGKSAEAMKYIAMAANAAGELSSGLSKDEKKKAEDAKKAEMAKLAQYQPQQEKSFLEKYSTVLAIAGVGLGGLVVWKVMSK